VGQRIEGLRIARMMLANGIALETVLRITGLSEEEITAAKR
jgi:predicted transposase YdaD